MRNVRFTRIAAVRELRSIWKYGLMLLKNSRLIDA